MWPAIGVPSAHLTALPVQTTTERRSAPTSPASCSTSAAGSARNHL